MKDLVSQLVGALERLSGQCERMRLPGQSMSDAEKNAIAALTAAKAGGWVAVPERTTGDAFENAIRRYGVVAACEWFGYAPDSEFTKETQRVLDERLQPLPNPPKEQAK